MREASEAAITELFSGVVERAGSDPRWAALIRLVRDPALADPLRACLEHPSLLVRQAAALSPLLGVEPRAARVLVDVLLDPNDPPRLDDGARTLPRLAALGMTSPALAAIARRVLDRGPRDRESFGALVRTTARLDPAWLVAFAERWLLEQVQLSSGVFGQGGLEYDGVAFDPELWGPHLYAALAEVGPLPSTLARLLTQISEGGLRRGYTAVFPLAAHGDPRALARLGGALEWVQPGLFLALGDAIVPHLVRTLTKRHSGVAYAFLALEALDRARDERQRFVRDVLEEVQLAPPGAGLTRSIELLSAAANALTGEDVWRLIRAREPELTTDQLLRLFELLARTQDPRLEPLLLERARARDGAAWVMLSRLRSPSAVRAVSSLERSARATDDVGVEARTAWGWLGRQSARPSPEVIAEAASTCRPSEVLSLALRAGAPGIDALFGALDVAGGSRVSLWDALGPEPILAVLDERADELDGRRALERRVNDGDPRIALLARAALSDVADDALAPAPFSIAWAERFRETRGDACSSLAGALAWSSAVPSKLHGLAPVREWAG